MFGPVQKVLIQSKICAILRKKLNDKSNLIFAGFDERKYYCILESKNESSPTIFSCILFIMIPLICIIGCYSAIYLKVKNGPKELLSLLGSNSGSDDIRKNIQERNFNLFRMIMVTSACFVIFITPMMVLKITMGIVSSSSQLFNVEKVFRVLQDANFIVNPFVYFFTNKNYRKAFIQLLPTKLRNIMIKDPPVDQKQYRIPLVEPTSSKNTIKDSRTGDAKVARAHPDLARQKSITCSLK